METSEVPCKFPEILKAGFLQRRNLVGAIGLELKEAGKRDAGLEEAGAVSAPCDPVEHSQMSLGNVPVALLAASVRGSTSNRVGV